MTGLLPLSVQRIFKNLNKIRRKVFHVGEGSLNTLDEIRKPFFRLGNGRKSRRREKCQKKHQKIPHIVESTPSEQHRSMRRRTTGNGLFCALSVSSVLLVFCSRSRWAQHCHRREKNYRHRKKRLPIFAPNPFHIPCKFKWHSVRTNGNDV